VLSFSFPSEVIVLLSLHVVRESGLFHVFS
jgi:hypothetical protein